MGFGRGRPRPEQSENRFVAECRGDTLFLGRSRATATRGSPFPTCLLYGPAGLSNLPEVRALNRSRFFGRRNSAVLSHRPRWSQWATEIRSCKSRGWTL